MSKAMQPLGLRAETAQNGEIHFYDAPLGGRRVGGLFPRFKRGDEAYLDAVDLFMMAMSGFPVPVTVQDADRPVFKVGGLGNFSLTGEAEGAAPRVYRAVAQSAAHNLLDFSRQRVWSIDLTEAVDTSKRTLLTGIGPGEVVAAYRWKASQPATSPAGAYVANTVTLSLGTVDAEGKVSLQVPPDAHFVTAQPAQPGNDVLLLRLTNTPFNNLKSGIFLPKP
ncbi:hypothetical protein [Deinococcus wulumuqiensis]|uniref:Uncharacterized protein n=1 Tax=Deinococcus wulumuqiensis TaxID=980427 RepID=A0AAV4JZE9_9DEIO|nr:hypothetical protein [Deinococcus wulumuqiensis]QII19589.1 hypothetical protein G6R31_01595 [Deinococcus wulumuqiensis R12]GGI69981.1 hypothetical protein GCM10010914_00010 [Deinococcus wulumuqiensis]GGP30230.1 hypothetical protein GCM10008021_18810 [Deinococcus wulumuqiensis]